MSEPAAPWVRRATLLVVAAMALVSVLAGLGRIGFRVPAADRALDHGPLFVLGVFGTVIALERAVALGTRWAFAAPLASALGGVGTMLHVAGAAWSSVAGSVVLVLANVAIVRRQSLAFTWIMLLGSLLLAGGSTAWALGRPVADVVPAWLAFFVLTILAERLELSRLAPTPRWASRLFVALALVLASASAALCVAVPHTSAALGACLTLLGLWQLRFDLARRLLQRPGLPRFTALGVLGGTLWLIVSGALLVRHGLEPAGPMYDAVLHAVLVGFVLSMVFAHAPIILPAVARIEVPYHRALYLPLAVLHLGLVARLGGDLGGLPDLRRAGAALNALALASFLMAVLWSRARRSRT